MLTISLPRDLVTTLERHAEQQGTTIELLVVENLRRQFDPPPITEEPAEGSLYDFLRDSIGVLHSSDYVEGGARLSENTGKRFAELMIEKRAKEQL